MYLGGGGDHFMPATTILQKFYFSKKASKIQHTGIFDLKIIANNAILLVISISTTFALLGSSKVSNEAKNFKELEFLGLSR